MGRIYKFLGLTVGIIVHDLDDQERQAELRLRHHLRHQQRVRLRLPARQHEVPPRGLRAARPQLRHRRRSRFHPDRRSPHPADHLRPERGIHRQVLQGQQDHPAPDARRGDRRQGARREVHHRRLHRRRKAPQRRAHRRGRRSRWRSCSACGNLYDAAEHRVEPPRAAGPESPRASSSATRTTW